MLTSINWMDFHVKLILVYVWEIYNIISYTNPKVILPFIEIIYFQISGQSFPEWLYRKKD